MSGDPGNDRRLFESTVFHVPDNDGGVTRGNILDLCQEPVRGLDARVRHVMARVEAWTARRVSHMFLP